METIKQYKPYIIFSSFIIGGLLVFALVSQGFYPIATVNGKIITAHDFWQKYQTDSAYYQNYAKSLEAAQVAEEVDPPTADDFKISALTQLVENIIIAEGAEKELGSDLEALVENKLSKVPNDDKFKKGVQAAYGANFSDFVDNFMVPLAKQEILEGRLFLKGEDFDEWFLKAKSEARVKIFSGEYIWDGQNIQKSTNQ